MALVTLSGYPCSGKTRRAHALKAFLEEKQPLPVFLLNDESQNIARSSYDEAATEKPARASLFSAVTRNLANDRIVICDAMNYIKGYRYQLYCAARESRARVCTLHIASPKDKCVEWNRERRERGEDAYADATLDNLVSRFEEPSSFVRWDSPLITIPWSDEHLPEEAILDAVLKGELKPPNAATVVAQTGTTDYLHLLESTCTAINTSLLSAQSSLPGGGEMTLTLSKSEQQGSSYKVVVSLPQRAVTMPQLQRAKRGFVNLQKQSKTEMEEERLGKLYAAYLSDSLR